MANSIIQFANQDSIKTRAKKLNDTFVDLDNRITKLGDNQKNILQDIDSLNGDILNLEGSVNTLLKCCKKSFSLFGLIIGTVNQINVVYNPSGTVTLSTPQDIHAGASPTFVGLTLSGLTQNSALFVGAGGVISEDNTNFIWDSINLRIETRQIRAGYDQDITSHFGRAAIGYGAGSNEATFAHLDNNSTTNYSLKQGQGGTTFINAKTGNPIQFMKNNVLVAQITDSIAEFRSAAAIGGFGYTPFTLTLSDFYKGGTTQVRMFSSGSGYTSSDGFGFGFSGGGSVDVNLFNFENGFVNIGTNAIVRLQIEANGDIHIKLDSQPLLFGAGKDMSVYYDGTYGNIDTDLVAPSDLIIDCGTNKTVELEETVWDDLRVPASAVRLGGAQPPIETAYKGGMVLAFPTNADKTMYFTAQIPHEYKQGTDIKFHIHWTIPTSGAGGGAENVKWDFTYSWANIDSTFPAQSSATITVDVQNDVLDDHMLDTVVTITGAAKNISSQLICSLTRDVSVANDYNDDAYIVEVDFHYEINTMGSRQEAVK